MIDIYINNIKIKVQKNITVLQACNKIKIDIPKFCFQETLQIAGNCRMCLIEIENSLKPVASCAMPVYENMKIFTDSPLVKKARESVLEFLLINHPLDCPICDQGSECDLQDQTLIFGSDKSRFFFNKRVVEDKYCGPFIKTIMTRCIHCTRCTRFVNEICKIDNLGTTGRGNKTEINFYNKNLFYSEFSGNLIDLCPVGALTSKPFTFKARSWELKKKEGIDILDSICSNIKIDIFNNEVIRILPKTNFNINKEWISNKTRFFFDSLKYQRILCPLFKNKNNTFESVSWLKAFNIINNKINSIDGSNIQPIIGNLVDLESIFLLKKFFNKFGVNNIKFENYIYNNNLKINSDLTSNFLLNNVLLNLNNYDLCIIINENIRKEIPIFNIHLIDRLKKGNFEISIIGNKINLTYPYTHLGHTLSILINILIGKHFFCKKIKKSKNPLFLFGEDILSLKNSYFLLSKFKNLSFLKKMNINFLNNKNSFINFLEINFNKNKFNINNSDLLYLYNTNLKKKLVKTTKNFFIYQGHHFNEDAQQSDLILPGLTFLEKEGIYINLEGIIQKIPQILNIKTQQKKDVIIYKYLYKFLIQKNKIKKKIIFLQFYKILPYLFLKKLKITNIFFFNKKKIKINFNYFKSLKKSIYYNNILEEFSKILINSNKILQTTKINFFKN